MILNAIVKTNTHWKFINHIGLSHDMSQFSTDSLRWYNIRLDTGEQIADSFFTKRGCRLTLMEA